MSVLLSLMMVLCAGKDSLESAARNRRDQSSLQQLSRAPGAGGAHGPHEAERWALLGQAQLAVGRIDEGRAALAEAGRLQRIAVGVGGRAAETPADPATNTATAAKTTKTAAVGAIAPPPDAARAATPPK